MSAAILATGVAQATSSTFTHLLSFAASDGANPRGNLLLGADGNFYGTSRSGGAYHVGSVIKLTPSGTVSVVHSFINNSTDGTAPYGGLLDGGDGYMYGTTQTGGTNGTGTLYKVKTDGTFSTVASFTGSNGSAPEGSLIKATDGNIYGTTNTGGSSDKGTIFKMAGDGTVTTLLTFTGSNGANPTDGVIEASDGNLYGTTSYGGSNDYGTVYKVTKGGSLTTLVDFDGNTISGIRPSCRLTEASDGNFYGTTYQISPSQVTDGTAFKVAPDGTFTHLTTFTGWGGNTVTKLLSGPDGNFYGMINGGGANDRGEVFQMTPSGTVTSLVDFANFTAPLGANPYGDLIWGPNGHLYATTMNGGANNYGTFFEVDPGFTPPAIRTEVVSGTALSNSATVAFGSVANHASLTKTFTIKNTGGLTLNVSGVTVTGGNAADFAVDTSSTSSTVAPGDQTTFDVTVTPAAVGTRTTTLQIASNDPGRSTFSLGLTASATVSSIFSFYSPTYTVNEGASSVSLTVSRAIATTAQTVQINTSNGTANTYPPYTGGVAGLDYNNLTGAATTLSFGIGQSTKTVVISLRPRSGSLPNIRFNATLSNPSAGATLGDVTTATIQILATDTVKPTLTVTSPSAGASFSAETTPTVTVSGTASDAKGISRVTITINGTTTTATLGDPISGAVPFSMDFSPVLGTNTVAVNSYDLRNNVTTISRTITLTGGVSLNIFRTVPTPTPPAVTPKIDTVGTVTVVATPTRSASAWTSTAANASPKTCLAVPGVPIRVTATALTGYAFSHWDGLPDGATALGNVLIFTMPSSAPSITAHFVVAPFTGAAGTSTSFYGLLHPSNGNASSVNTEGFVVGGLSVGTGAFTGSVYIDGLVQPVTAAFFGDGSAVFTVAGNLASTLTFGNGRTLTMSYNAGAGNDTISVTTVKDGITSAGDTKRAYYSPTNKVPSTLINELTSGFFTFAIPTKDQTPTKNKATYPQGDGYGTFTLYNTGVVSMAGTLADGTAFTCSSALVDSHNCPFFAQLTTPAGSTKLGVLSGTLVFDPTNHDSDVTATDLLWLRPAASGSARYTAGWPDGINVDFVGGVYTRNATAQTTLALGAVNPTSGNGKLVFSDGKLTGSVTDTAFSISNNTTQYLSATPSFMLSIGSNGAFSGSFTPNWSPQATSRPTFSGIMLQKGSNKGGYGFFFSNILGDSAPESGGVTLSHQ